MKLRTDHLSIAYLLLVPALLLFAVRAILEIAGRGHVPGWSMAVVGIMSGAGMVLAVSANWKNADKWRTITAVAVALLGHYVVARFYSPDLGGAMVYLGTGFLVSLRVRWAQYTGMVAGIGALLRAGGDGVLPHGLLALGAMGTAAAAILAALERGPEDNKDPQTP